MYGSFLLTVVLLAGTSAQPTRPAARGKTLEERLRAESPAALIRDARSHGDPGRGAALFHQPQLACAKCHPCGDTGPALGPDLARLGKDATDQHLLESILLPSKVIRKGFETVTIVTTRGVSHTGVVARETKDAVVLLDLAKEGRPVTIPRARIETRTASSKSLMPAGLVNGLDNRQQFLDLLRFLMDVVQHGPVLARVLRPAVPVPPLPAYEADLDHAGLIASLDAVSLRRGEAIYHRLCVSCHGTKDQPGSLPTSLRFASDKFKNGSDPYRMYRTLTTGFGLMTPQTTLVPRQKYDVVHYVRETYLRRHNPTQYTHVDRAYFDRLPKGSSRGPEPVAGEPWSAMDYGPSMMGTFEVGKDGKNFAYKGIAVRLDHGPGGVAKGTSWALYDHDTLRLAAAWTGKGFIDWNGIHFNGRHQVHPRLAGKVHVATPAGPGWADPDTGSFADPRLVGRDGRRYAPLPRRWAHYRGLYHHGQQVVVLYTVGTAEILETPGREIDPTRKDTVVFTRTLQVGPARHALVARLARATTAVALVGGGPASLREKDGLILLEVPPRATALTLKLLFAEGDRDALARHAKKSPPPASLQRLVQGGAKRWPRLLTTKLVRGADSGPFAVDELALPDKNPWQARLRLTGLDFLPGGKGLVVCTWDGDVWRVCGLESASGELTWQRIATGLFQPLGLKVVGGHIYVTCRDQIAILRDLDGDGETDFYENFNNDHQVTEHFHEFAMGLQTDAAGHFYYAKSACHAKQAVVPHHGTLLRVSKDGTRTDIVATGFRAANGVCVNADGTFFVTDQEGHWTPKNRINLVRPGGFYGNMWGYHDVKDDSDRAMQQPLCWITNRFDRSPAELLWVDSAKWGPLKGALLNFSYGMGKIFLVPHEKVAGQVQGGMCELPLPVFPTGVMRGRFHPGDGHLYTCGMYAWAGNQQQPGGLYRVRATGKPMYLPVGLSARKGAIELRFTGQLDAREAGVVGNYLVRSWSLKRTASYGSPHVGEKALAVTRAQLLADSKTLVLHLPELRPTWCMEVAYAVRSASGEPVVGVIHNTVHVLGEPRQDR
jgi:putative heme-binding domain-containing protein